MLVELQMDRGHARVRFPSLLNNGACVG